MLNKWLKISTLFACLFLVSFTGSVWAGVSAEEAAKLKTTLTPLGGERAGNADGTIPAWKGGITKIPAGFVKNKPHIDPFVDDKVLFTITAANMDQYADKLAPGQQNMLKKWPDTYSINVYKTRRTQSAPQWVYDETFKNATRSQITEDGLGISNAFGGIVFPIPKGAEEVMWNFLSRWRGEFINWTMDNIIVPKSGSPFVSATSLLNERAPMYDRDMGFEKFSALKTPTIFETVNQYIGPPRKNGEIILVKDPLDSADKNRLAWQYLPGQRRVRRAPTVAYDTPNSGTQALMTYDDVLMYNGSLDRYDWKIVGKKEMYIPYNCYGQELKIEPKELYHPNHPNPKYWRWELHRVWVVESTVKKDARHIYAKRVFYLDEDSWACAMRDVYDAQGSLWRTAYNALKNNYELPGVIGIPSMFIDFYATSYIACQSLILQDGTLEFEKKLPSKFWSPENIRSLGKR